MTSVNKKLSLFLFLLLMLLPARTAVADTGPKPTMEFDFIQPATIAPLSIVSGILYECRQSDCSDAALLQDLGPQGFRCSLESCDALAYGFAPYHKLEIEFSDGKTRESNIFKTAGFDSVYTVTIQPDDLLVEMQLKPSVSPGSAAALLLCACFCGGLLVIGLVVFFVWRSTRK